MPITTVGSINGRCRFHNLDPLPQRSFPGSLLRKPAQLAARCAVPPRSRADRRSKMSCRIRKSQRNGWRCFCKSSATLVRGSSWRHAQVSIKLRRNAESLESAVVQLRRGATAKMEEFLEQLAASGYERVSQVTTRGQFAVRGGIVDLYSWHAPLPFRLEFSGDQIESLREFDIDTQTSVRDLRSIDILLNQGAADQSGEFAITFAKMICSSKSSQHWRTESPRRGTRGARPFVRPNQRRLD